MKNSKNIKPSTYEKILANNHALSVILQENEELYKQLVGEGVDAPREKELIRFPVGRVKFLEEYEKLYHLPEIIKRNVTVKNAGYCLQVCEIYKYMTERFAFYGPVQSMMYKDWFICMVSVIEALVDTSTQHLDVRGGGFQDKLKDEYREIVGLSTESVERLKNLYELRNSIHLERNKIEKIKKLDFKRTDVDNAEKAFVELVELLYQNAVPNYKK